MHYRHSALSFDMFSVFSLTVSTPSCRCVIRMLQHCHADISLFVDAYKMESKLFVSDDGRTLYAVDRYKNTCDVLKQYDLQEGVSLVKMQHLSDMEDVKRLTIYGQGRSVDYNSPTYTPQVMEHRDLQLMLYQTQHCNILVPNVKVI